MNTVVRTLFIVLALASVLLPATFAAEGKPVPVIPTDGMKITSDTTFAPGVYSLKNGVEIAADGITLDGGGAVLVGTDFTGSAVRAVGRKKITIKNVTAERYRHGIRLEDCSEVTIESNSITRTAELEPGKHWLGLMVPADQAYGAGVLLIKVRGGKVAGNFLEHQQNGICMYSCTGLTIEKNDTCYSSGWGIYLNDSCDNTIRENLSDFCVREHFRGGEPNMDYMGADAAGIVLVVNSCRNKVLKNMFRSGGDGIFLAGSHGQCNDNLFEGNDCSYSPNNAIEATFSKGNTFRKNRCAKSNYGLWLGYSSNCMIVENEVILNMTSGVAIDHGSGNTIRGNYFASNRQGILLWSGNPVQERPDLPGIWDSKDYTITENNFESNRVGIYSITPDKGEARCYNYTIARNRFSDNRVGILLTRTNNCTLDGNTFQGNVVEDIRQVACTGNKVTNSKTLEPAANVDARTLPFASE